MNFGNSYKINYIVLYSKLRFIYQPICDIVPSTKIFEFPGTSSVVSACTWSSSPRSCSWRCCSSTWCCSCSSSGPRTVPPHRSTAVTTLVRVAFSNPPLFPIPYSLKGLLRSVILIWWSVCYPTLSHKIPCSKHVDDRI